MEERVGQVPQGHRRAGQRPVAVDSTTISALRAHRRAERQGACGRHRETSYIFTTRNGDPIAGLRATRQNSHRSHLCLTTCRYPSAARQTSAAPLSLGAQHDNARALQHETTALANIGEWPGGHEAMRTNARLACWQGKKRFTISTPSPHQLHVGPAQLG